MQLHGVEIERRKELIGFNTSDCAVLLKVRPLLLPEVDSIVTEFYDHITKIDEIVLIIGDKETMRRVQASQKQYIDDLFSGVYDEEYVNNRLRIGLVHKRLGVEPKYYLAALKLLKDILERRIESKVQDSSTAAQVLVALDKLLTLDTIFIFDTYIRTLVSEIEAAKAEVIRYASSLEAKVIERTQALAELSRVDSLTGILNQRAFYESLLIEVARCKRRGTPLTAIYIDLDDFKAYNDTNGHLRGDELLIRVANAIRRITRETDIVARLGGDEFCVVVTECDNEGAMQYVAKLRDLLVDLEFSAGTVTVGPKDYLEPNELVRSADERMYEDKRVRRAHLSGESDLRESA
ncbi:MAG: hypothetical protein HONBIEJF_00980 [Fimbriimonadaceae bacterium]|nr:hypothetical protein [Fimbriimonadaceae bacterium]